MTHSNVNYNLYKCFIRVYEERNISKAASLLQITQPTVTYNIKELERQLGVRLFHTHPRGVEPTRDAKELYKYVQEGLSAIANGESRVKEFNHDSPAHMRIGVMGQVISKEIAKVIAGFCQVHPNVTFEMFDVGKEPPAKLLQHNTEMIIGAIDTPTGNLADIILSPTKYIALASEFFMEKHQLPNKITLEDMKKLPLIIFECDKTRLERLGDPIVTVSDFPTMKSMVSQDIGLGICLEAYASESGLKKLDLSQLEIPTVHIRAIFNRNTINKPTKALLEAMAIAFGTTVKY